MNRSDPGSWRSLGAGALALTVALLAGVIVAELAMAPPMADLLDLAAYLAASGAATLALGWLALMLGERALSLSIRAKAFLGALIASGVALLNVFIVARLMFLDTAHDLPLLVVVLVFSGVVTTFFAAGVAAAVTRRLGAVSRAIEDLAHGHYDRRLIVSGQDEVAALASAVDGLGARLHEAERERDRLDRERRELTTAISHDLRTPLASVRAMAEALADGVVDDPAEVKRYYATMGREIDRLTRMIDDLFELARIDAGIIELQRQTVRLQDVAAEVVDAMSAQAAHAGVALALRVDGDPAPLTLDGARVERAIANLVRNALEHTPAGGSIDVVVTGDPSGVSLRVADTGFGIDEAHLSRIWERFFRSDSSRRRAAAGGDGAGLGLAIVKGIVEAHGGTVEAASSPEGGAAFTVRLPA